MGTWHPGAGDLRAGTAFAEDRAAALGRTGRSLAQALAAYREAVAAGCSSVTEAVLLDEVATWTYRLLLQRECAGARTGNLDAIQVAYDLPDAVLRRL
jgi:transcriptional regulator of nitric oxide reductase